MTWIKFIYWLLGFYTLYYLANIAWDLLRSKRQPAGQAPELHFEEAAAPQKVIAEKPKEKTEQAKAPQKEPVISAMGGVNLKDLFNLAKAEVIAYNRGVSF